MWVYCRVPPSSVPPSGLPCPLQGSHTICKYSVSRISRCQTVFFLWGCTDHSLNKCFLILQSSDLTGSLLIAAFHGIGTVLTRVAIFILDTKDQKDCSLWHENVLLVVVQFFWHLYFYSVSINNDGATNLTEYTDPKTVHFNYHPWWLRLHWLIKKKVTEA